MKIAVEFASARSALRRCAPRSLLLVTLLLSGCWSLGDVPTSHIVLFDNQGRALDPSSNLWGFHSMLANYGPLERGGFQAQLDGMFRGVDEWHRERTGSSPSSKKHVLVYIHGGMNTHVRGVERAVELHDDILAGGYYPIFVNWQSSLVTSYWDHLWSIRQGKDVFPWGAFLAPYYLLEDLTRGVVRLPMTMYFQVVAVWEQIIAQIDDSPSRPARESTSLLPALISTMRSFLSVENPQAIREELEARYRERRHHFTGEHPGAIAVSHGEDKRGTIETVIPWITHILTLPTKILSAALIDAAGKSAWDNMLRNARVLFHPEKDFYADNANVVPSGGLSVFFRRLSQEYERDRRTGVDWSLTLVSHSMGGIVLNEIIREFPTLRYDRIVYLSTACTIRDYQDTVFPYLQSKPGRKTEVFHVTLHELAETGERPLDVAYIDPVIRGSLLVWIDGSFATPQTHLDLTAGRFNNLMVTAHDTPEAIRDRIHVKSCSIGASANDVGEFVDEPQRHVDVQRTRFWKGLFLEPDFPGD